MVDEVLDKETYYRRVDALIIVIIVEDTSTSWYKCNKWNKQIKRPSKLSFFCLTSSWLHDELTRNIKFILI